MRTPFDQVGAKHMEGGKSVQNLRGRVTLKKKGPAVPITGKEISFLSQSSQGDVCPII